MNHLNKVIMQGNLVRDPEKKDLGTSILCKFTLASNRKFKEKESTCFVDIIVWGKLAELCDKYLLKGKPVIIEGRLELDTWTNDKGEKRSKHVVTASEVVFLPTGKKDDTENEPIKVEDNIIKQNGPVAQVDAFDEEQPKKNNINLDDLPF